MQTATLEFHQTKNAQGQPVDTVTEQQVTQQGWKEIAESVLDAVKHLDIKETNQPGVFTYADPTVGSGTVTLKGFYHSDIALVTDLLRLLAISKSMGAHDPNRHPETTGFNMTMLRTTNPFVQILLGAVMAGMGGAVLATVFIEFTGQPIAFWLLIVISLLLIVFGIYVLFWFGARRLSWWLKARAEARRLKMPLPRQLKFWN